MLAPNALRVYVALALVLGLTQAGQGQAGAEPALGAQGTVELPELQPGMWEFHRTLLGAQRGRPQVTSVKKCSDPRADYARKMQDLRGKGCQFSPLRQNGNRFEAAWRCPVKGGSVMLQNVVIIRSSTSYTDETQTRTQDETTHTVITANRRGDCTPSQGDTQSPSAATRVPSRPTKRTM
jgi:hypothetical protein